TECVSHVLSFGPLPRSELEVQREDDRKDNASVEMSIHSLDQDDDGIDPDEDEDNVHMQKNQTMKKITRQFASAIKPPDSSRLRRHRICFLADTSDSMGYAIKDDNGYPTSANSMDFLKTGLLMFVRTLSPLDEFCLIQFDSYPQLRVAMTSNVPSNLASIEREVHRLKPDGCTEISKALKMAVEKMYETPSQDKNTNFTIILATDGEPTSPSDDVMATVRSCMKDHPELSIVTYGMGPKA